MSKRMRKKYSDMVMKKVSKMTFMIVSNNSLFNNTFKNTNKQTNNKYIFESRYFTKSSITHESALMESDC